MEPSPEAAPPAAEGPGAGRAAPSNAESELTPPRLDADYLDNPPPDYPALSRRLGEEGKVVLRVFVEPSGTVGELQVHSGSGSSRLDEAARAAVHRWKFLPARRGGEPVGAWVLVPVNFTLGG